LIIYSKKLDTIECKWVLEQVCRLSHLSAGVSVRTCWSGG